MRGGFEETLAGLRENTRTLKELSAQIAAQREEFIAESRASRARFEREVDARFQAFEARLDARFDSFDARLRDFDVRLHGGGPSPAQ